MPGILPMKVIKVGCNAQSRIAQACDRCRSKKIRCDGVRPCCSQCSNVGFECKTSDKLSRRAFPRGYTESLEDRVRALESEVRELKDLLDEKDEKIDMLSKMHSNRRPSTSSMTSSSDWDSRQASRSPAKEDTFRMYASPTLVAAEKSEGSDAYFMGASSGRNFVDALKRKIQESGRSCDGLNTAAFFHKHTAIAELTAVKSEPTKSSVPPRMFSDRVVNIYFQEWAPLFPVLHRQTFLKIYEEYVTKPDAMKDNHKLAQLHLVLSIAGLSSTLPDKEHVWLCEQQWQKSIDAILMDKSLATLQILVLATMYCLSKGEYERLQHYKGIAVTLCYRLGLHQSQKRFSLGALTTETRKKSFWTLYTVDCFSAALLGLPKLLKEDDIHCEMPVDIDDEYVTERGYLPTLPGESSKLSNGLALFRVSRILSKVLQTLYPAATSNESSLQQLAALELELNQWSDSLPQHLKLTFAQDKPSTNVTGSRSCLLSLAHYYVKSLIHRPAVGSTLGHKASSSILSLAESSKRIIQIVQLLEERGMSFSFCLNKDEILTLCGLSLLYQNVDLKPGSSVFKDSQRLMGVVAGYLDKHGAALNATHFRRMTNLISPSYDSVKPADVEPMPARYHLAEFHGMPAPSRAKSVLIPPPLVRNNSLPEVTRRSLDLEQLESNKFRRATLPNMSGAIASNRTASLSQHSLPLPSESSPQPQRTSSISKSVSKSINIKRWSTSPKVGQNLDYLSLSNTPSGSPPSTPVVFRQSSKPYSSLFLGASRIPTPEQAREASSVSAAEWENLLSSLDGGLTNIYDAVYGGPPISLPSHPFLPHSQLALSSTKISDLHNPPAIGSHSVYGGVWDQVNEQWDLTSLTMNESTHLEARQTQSVLSFSEESLSSSDDLLGDVFGSVGSDSSPGIYRAELNQDLTVGGSGSSDEFFSDLADSFGL